MRRIGLALCGLGLVGCGSLSSVPTPLAGDLLGAPTTLNVGGQVVRVTAAPQLGAQRFSVRVRVAGASGGAAADQPTPGTLKVTGIYVVTGAGLWKSPRLSDAPKNCALHLCAWASGSANGFVAGEGVRVIAQLQDERGRSFWLRDAQTRNIR